MKSSNTPQDQTNMNYMQRYVGFGVRHTFWKFFMIVLDAIWHGKMKKKMMKNWNWHQHGHTYVKLIGHINFADHFTNIQNVDYSIWISIFEIWSLKLVFMVLLLPMDDATNLVAMRQFIHSFNDHCMRCEWEKRSS